MFCCTGGREGCAGTAVVDSFAVLVFTFAAGILGPAGKLVDSASKLGFPATGNSCLEEIFACFGNDSVLHVVTVVVEAVEVVVVVQLVEASESRFPALKPAVLVATLCWFVLEVPRLTVLGPCCASYGD